MHRSSTNILSASSRAGVTGLHAPFVLKQRVGSWARFLDLLVFSPVAVAFITYVSPKALKKGIS